MTLILNNNDIKYLKLVAKITKIHIYLFKGYELLKDFSKSQQQHDLKKFLKQIPEYQSWYKNRLAHTVDINFLSIKRTGIIGGISLDKSHSLVIYVSETSNHSSFYISEFKDLDVIRIRDILILLFYHFFNYYPKLLADQSKNLNNDNIPIYTEKSALIPNTQIEEIHNQILHAISTMDEKSYEHCFEKVKDSFLSEDIKTIYPHINSWLISEITLYCQAAEKGGLPRDNINAFKIKAINEVALSNKIIEPVEYIYSIGKFILKRMKRYKPSESYLVNKVNQYLNDHIRSKLSMDELSKYIGFNKSYLMTVYKAETNITINKQFNKLKIEAAKTRLLYTDDSVRSVSEYFDFKSPNYFSTVFKKYTGQSPKYWQKIRRVSA